MPAYIVLYNWTEQGIKTVKEGSERTAKVKAAVEGAGGKWIESYVTFGQYDGVALFEVPDDETAMSLLLLIGQQGSVRTTTLKAIPSDEAARIIDELP